MSPVKQIPFLKVSGSHFECGKQIGIAFKEQIHNYLDLCRNDLPENLSWNDCVKQAEGFLEPTLVDFPQIIDEIKGAAEGAEVDFGELFAGSIEEFDAKDYHIKGCTDIVTLPPASEHTLVAHNNDLPASLYDMLTAVEWSFDDGSRMFTVGLAGIFVSVGVNSSKIVLSGNEVTPTDNRVGIPRAIIARAILLADSFDGAIKIATNPNRASSYNNIVTTKNQSVSVEASATDFELIFPTNGILTHSNHYCSTKMKTYEGDPNYVSSKERLKSANKLATNSKNIDLKTVELFLSDHGHKNIGNNDTICRHGEKSISTFGFAVDLDEGVVELASGLPCQNPFLRVWKF